MGFSKNGIDQVLYSGTVIMPTFSETGRTNPPPHDRPLQNGWDYAQDQIDTTKLTPFNPDTFDKTSELNVSEMGRIPLNN